MAKGIYERSPELREKLRLKLLRQRTQDKRIGFKKGNMPINAFKKGNKVGPRFEKGNPFEFEKGHQSSADEKHYLWKGEAVSYRALHAWIERKLGKPSKCSHCKKKGSGFYEWANIPGTYKRNLADWRRLCVSCHRLFDKGKLFIVV